MSTGASRFNRPRSSSVDVFAEPSYSVKSNVSIPSKTKRKTECHQQEETSYLVIGGGGIRKEEVYVNYQSELSESNNLPEETEKASSMTLSVNSQTISDKPETTSSSSSSALSSLRAVSGTNYVLKSSSSLHDSTISRLIDAVSLGNEEDTCCSVSALIDQFDLTADKKNLTTPSQNITPSQNLRSPFIAKMTSPKGKPLINPQKANNVNPNICSSNKTFQADKSASGVILSPETAELEEVYTILDEEVLTPVSVYNLRKQTIHVQADTTGSPPSSSLVSSPVKVIENLGKGRSVGWNGVDRMWGEREVVEPEERVYEEVKDTPDAALETEQATSKRYMSSSDFVQILHHSTGESFTEVELNVDEDPLEILPNHSTQWGWLSSPVKDQAIYQNNNFSPSFSQPKNHSLYTQPQDSTQSSHATRSLFTFPVIKQSKMTNHIQQKNFHLPLCQRYVNSGPLNPSPLRQNRYPIPKSNFQVLNSHSSDLRSCSSTLSCNWSLQHRLENNQVHKKERGGFSFSSAESVLHQCAVSQNRSRQRALYSPSSEYKGSQSILDCGCIMSSSESKTSKNIQLHSHGQTHTINNEKYMTKPIHNKHQQSEVRDSLQSNLEPSSSYFQSSTTDSTPLKPCKSKSLGDLTSEDISSNFQSKYHIISRSFLTPQTTRQKPIDTIGFHTKSCDPLTEQLRKLVSLELDDGLKERPQSPQLQKETESQPAKPQETSVSPIVSRDLNDSPPPMLARRLSSRSQSRVRHINSRAREKQQEALKARPGVAISSDESIGGVVLRNKQSMQNQPPNRHSTGSYIAGYLDELEDRGLPEGACTSVRYGNADHFRDRYYTDDSLPLGNTYHSESEPEVYFLLRL